MILAFAGGVGGAKLVAGLAEILPPSELVIVVNTGDDFQHLGLHISPDIDTVMYTLAGIANPETGWGIAGDTWHCMQALERVGGETWFKLGDQDLATHLERSRRLRAGESLSEVTAVLCGTLGVRHRVVPMSDQVVQTVVMTDAGPLPFQDYFVRLRSEPAVRGFHYQGAQLAQPCPALRMALENEALRAVVICPSNPYLSIRPILEIPGVTDTIRARRLPVVAVSPIVGGRALKGPAAKILRELGNEPSALEVAKYYQGLLSGLVIDSVDAALVAPLRELGVTPYATNTIMGRAEDRVELARQVLEFVALLAASPRAVRKSAAGL